MWLMQSDTNRLINTDYVIMFEKEWAHQDSYYLFAKLSNGDKIKLLHAHTDEVDKQMARIETYLADGEVRVYHMQERLKY